jgi:hypothetical protein
MLTTSPGYNTSRRPATLGHASLEQDNIPSPVISSHKATGLKQKNIYTPYAHAVIMVNVRKAQLHSPRRTISPSYVDHEAGKKYTRSEDSFLSSNNSIYRLSIDGYLYNIYRCIDKTAATIGIPTKSMKRYKYLRQDRLSPS